MTDQTYRNSGAILWDKAKAIIPGGNQLLSKRAEQFLPDYWPAYYQKASGCKIQDLDGNWLRDFSIMGIGTCSLGYANPEINEAVIQAISDGSMSSLNCYEEVELAEKLIELHSWAGGVRFTRGGGESCSLAVRIARAYSGKMLFYLAATTDGTTGIWQQTSTMAIILTANYCRGLSQQASPRP